MSNKRYGLKSKNVSISPPISLANNESEVRAARSMLRISGVGNFETINEGDEPAKPEESDKSEVFYTWRNNFHVKSNVMKIKNTCL